MTKIAHFYCDWCNQSCQTREEGDEVSTGYAAEVGDGFPLGWWDVPGVGPKGTVGHACPDCVLHNEQAKVEIAERRGEMSRRLTGDAPVVRDAVEAAQFNEHYGLEGDERVKPSEGRWPSIASPFSDAGGGADGRDG